MKLQAIIFDVDGTLWNTTDYVADAWNRAGADFGAVRECPVTGADLRKEFGKPMNVISQNLFPAANSETQEKIWLRCSKYEHEVLRSVKKSMLYHDAQKVLQDLSQSYQVFIVSNCQKGYIPLFLEKNDLQNYVDDFECFGETLLSKGANIRLIMERNGVTDAIYVGDTEGDFQATKEAGIPFIFANYGFGDVENPEMSVDNLSELPKIVEKLANPNCDNR